MFRIAIRSIKSEKDDVLSATVTQEEAQRVQRELADDVTKPADSSKSFIIIEAQDKKLIMVRREFVLSIVVWEDRDR